MRHQHISLLMVFDAIMTEGSITRAASRLSMTQPAVSNALSRMRMAWKDELFVKDGRGIQPTVYAQNLWAQIREPLQQLETAVAPEQFDPATSNRTFRVVTTDISVNTSWLGLRKVIETQAPGVNIHAIPNLIQNNEQVLVDADADMVICGKSVHSSVIRSKFILAPRFVVAMRPEHPLARGELTLKKFLTADHLLVSLSGDANGVTDDALGLMGLKRRVAMTVNHFSAIPALLKGSDLISVCASIVIEREIINRELVVFEPPIELEPTHLYFLWHKRQDKDLGLTWLREQFYNQIHQRSKQHEEDLARFCRKNCSKQLKQSLPLDKML